jgi:DNA (cytosine-5)-methyltransferase 1
MPAKLTYISLFSGAGGLDLGLEAAGFQVQLCVENDPKCRATLSRNRPRWPLATPGDIHKLSSADVLSAAGGATRKLDLLAGGPPCQPWSKASLWTETGSLGAQDPRSKTIHAYFAIVAEVLPRVILLENVRGLVSRREGRELVENNLTRINAVHGTKYKATFINVNADDYGVPQFRERIFMLASIDGRSFTMPLPTHGPDRPEPHRTAWDAIGHLDTAAWPAHLTPRGRWADLLPSIPEGHNYLWHTERGGGEPLFGWRRRYWSFLLKLAKDRPSWTISAAPGPAAGPFHWRNRLLSVRELAALQTFPSHYVFTGDRHSVHKQIGNAVPCAIGELMGREIRRQFLGGRPHHSLRLVPDSVGAPPRRYPAKKVPASYLSLSGIHPEHPGTGKGPSPRRRALQG